MEIDIYTQGRAVSTRGPGVETREVRWMRWRPAKTPARPRPTDTNMEIEYR
jgi:hypothetical protein